MFNVAIILFALAAVGGLWMATLVFRGAVAPPPAIAALHGLLAASGIVVLLMGIIQAGAAGRPGIALALFVIAALGGFTLLSFHVRKRVLPKAVIIAHALVAVCGFLTLLWAVLAPPG
jgi:hypothetical protein